MTELRNKDNVSVIHDEARDMDKPREAAITVSQKMESIIRKKVCGFMAYPEQTLIYRPPHAPPSLCSYLDRGNIGNAKTAGVQDDLRLNDSQKWVWVLNSFYITYTLFEWTTLLWKLLPAHLYIAGLSLMWGIAATCTGTVKNMAGICACPAALGILEAAFGAGAPYFLSLFYQRQELGLRVAILIGMSPLGNCFASSLAYGISQIHSSVETWRLILLIGNPPLAQLPNCCDIN
ncbi:unnamed protein product [Clonostachys rosea f. rosea IK726]|uniref:Major facilitator superfamily (MFS) profile domain-containing protein n=2 Tax=Bionectria ochroleuca TaxID=29856 RepID=A0A0B7K0S0_BIOOC|nr:unnamed protein product [Clonostachys rosea f. rosea IK726]